MNRSSIQNEIKDKMNYTFVMEDAENGEDKTMLEGETGWWQKWKLWLESNVYSLNNYSPTI